MKIAFNPSTVAALTSPPKNKDITFDLRGRNIFARGVEFKGTDTNTWRDIKVNNVSIGSHTLDLRNGSNITLTNSNGVVTINSTWRPVVDSLTSDSTTSSLSANQGRVLKSLIDGKSDSGHNHDDRYLKLIGGTLTGNLVGTSAMFSGRFYGSGDDEGIIIKPSSNGYAGLILGAHDGERSIFYFVKNKPFWRYSHGSDNLDIIHPKKSGTIALTSDIPSSLKNPYALTISLNGTSQGPYDGSAAKSINITPGSIGAATSGHNHDGRYVYNYGGTQMDGSSRNKNALGMSTTSGISGDWWHILQAAWDDEYRWNSQIAFPTQNRNGVYYRSGLDDNTKWGAWVKLLDSNNYNTFHHLLTNGNTTVSTSTWTNLFSAYNKNAIADGQAICVWGQNSRKYSDNEKFSTDTGDMSLWLKRVNANLATLNMVLDGEYYANGNQRLAHISEIPNKNSWNYDDRYLKLTGGTLKGQIILPDIDVNTSYTGSIIIGASNTENLGIDGNEIMARNNGKASTLYLNNEGGAVQLGAILRTNSNIAYIGSQSTRDMIKFINNTNDPYGNGIAIGGGGLTIIGGGEACDVIAAHYNVTSETMHVGSDSSLYLYSNLDGGWNNRETITFDTNGFTYFPSYINIGGNENNNSSPDRVWGSNGSDSYLRSYRTSALNVANADTVDGYHASHLLVKRGRLGDYNIDHETTFGTRDIQPASEITISGKKPFNGWGTLLVIGSLDGASNHQLAFTGDNRMFIRCAYGTSNNYNTKDWATVALTSDNVASATKLQTARTIWGQSFDGTGYVNGTIYINNNNSSNGAIRLNDDVNSNARISAIDNQVIFNTGAAIRFGETAWNWNKWAGLKYTHSNKTIYLGIAENSAFNANNAQSDGILRLAGIKTITPDSGARIGNTGGDLYLGNSNNSSWVKVQDMCSQIDSNYWRISQGGNATFKYIESKGNADIVGTLKAGQIIREASSQIWVNGRNGALLRETSVAGYHALWSLKTTDGSWDFGEYNVGSGWNNIPVLTYITDSNYNSGNNTPTYQIKFPLASGTVALTSQASSFDVNTAQYLRSLGNQNCQTGRTQAYGDVYSYNTYNNTGSPTAYTSVIGFGRGIAGTVEIAGGWSNTNLYWRSLKDCCEDWYSWRTVLDSNNYTDFIGSYYWANVKISTTSSTSTSPTVSTLTATSSVRAGNICLEHTDEINNITGGGVNLNYRNSGNVSLCVGGGNVGIGTMSPSSKLAVNGQVISNGFRHGSVNSNDYVLLAGGGYMIHKTGTTEYSTAIQFGKYVWLTIQMYNTHSKAQVVPGNISKPTKNIYVYGAASDRGISIWRISTDGVIYMEEGVSSVTHLYTTICYVASI